MRPERGQQLLTFVVPGQPAGAGSKQPMPKGRMVGGRFQAVTDQNGRPVFYVKPASEATEPWMKRVEEYARLEWRNRGQIGGSLFLDVNFFENRPGDHYFKRKAGDILRPDAPAWPHQTKTHDVDKMRRAISDSLTRAEVLVDDKRVVGGEQWKFYCEAEEEEPRAVLRLGRMKLQTAQEAGLISAPAGQETLT